MVGIGHEIRAHTIQNKKRTGVSRCQHFATAQSQGPSAPTETWAWPQCTDNSTVPTPYQILSLRKGESYSKKRFYELVKLYHPDKIESESVNHTNQAISKAKKLERFRLIVQANDILSDTGRRYAYDCYGMGWDGTSATKSGTGKAKPPHEWDIPSNGKRAHGWTGFSDNSNSAANNATWEDWERWYQTREAGDAGVSAQGPQVPNYVSNLALVSIIAIFTALGAVGELTRAKNFSLGLLDKRDHVHGEASKQLMRTRLDTREGLGASRDERVQSFIYARQERIEELEDVNGGGRDEDDAYQKLLTLPDRCASRAPNSEGSSAETRADS